MFQSLRPNSPIYILHKGDSLTFDTGYVTNVSAPKSKWGLTPNFTQPQELVVDLSVKVNEQLFNYLSLPATLDIADSFTNGESIIISDSKEAMNNEVLNLKKKSLDVLDSIDTNKRLIVEYDKILCMINPEIAEKQTLKEEISSLKSQMTEMNKSMQSLMETNRSLLEQLKLRHYENVGNNGNSLTL